MMAKTLLLARVWMDQKIFLAGRNKSFLILHRGNKSGRKKDWDFLFPNAKKSSFFCLGFSL